MKQAMNPYLPVDVYIPDGEPHVFGDRVYIFGSHDKEGGETFCMLDYEVYSAPLSELGNWRSEGIIYSPRQDPYWSEKYNYAYAPDVVRGNDGRYYLYYALAGGCFTGPIHVAVCDTPAGRYEYYGEVRNQDGTVFDRNITFDPGVLNDDGIIRLYYGWALAKDFNPEGDKTPQQAAEELKVLMESEQMRKTLHQVELQMFGKTEEQLARETQGIQGAFTVVLDNDMLTVLTEPQKIVPGQLDSLGSSFEGHAFFEASSVRKIGETYYFIYSSETSHELCYATSKFPDKGFIYQGVIISNGDIGYKGRKSKDRLASTGNNHGSIECINGRWYIFYHRQTHKTTFSRQGCAEEITIGADGTIAQAEMTSCGLNSGPLAAAGEYPAVIACILTNGKMPHISTDGCEEDIPYITHEGEERFISDISEGTRIGYKYFAFRGSVMLGLTIRGNAKGRFKVLAGEEAVGEVLVTASDEWKHVEARIDVTGSKALYLDYEGEGYVQVRELSFQDVCKKF